MGVGAGETVTCTFTYVKRGHIRIDKVTVPSGDPQSFDFTLAGGPDGSTRRPASPTRRRPGTAVRSVRAPTPRSRPTPERDGDLTGATCDDGSAPGSISLEPGETVTCTFTNTKRALLTIVKESIPDDPQDFGFTITGADYNGSDPRRRRRRGSLPRAASVLLVNGAYTIVESDPGTYVGPHRPPLLRLRRLGDRLHRSREPHGLRSTWRRVPT